MNRRRSRRWLLVLLVVLVVVVVGACVGRDLKVGSGDYEVPTLLGWLWPGNQPNLESYQFSSDGRMLYVKYGAGACDELLSAGVSRSQAGVLHIEIRTSMALGLVTSCTANLVFYVTRIALDPAIDPAVPPRVIQVVDGQPVDLFADPSIQI